jgi:hypothetical protein
LTPAQLDRIQELLDNCPQARLVCGVEGSLTDDGMAIEWPGGVVHPLAFLALAVAHELDEAEAQASAGAAPQEPNRTQGEQSVERGSKQ